MIGVTAMKRTAICAAVIAASGVGGGFALAGEKTYPCGGHGDAHKHHHRGDHDHHHKSPKPCDCAGVKGAKGDAGPQGPVGPAGPQGPAGKTTVIVPKIVTHAFKVPKGAASCQMFAVPLKGGRVIDMRVVCVDAGTHVPPVAG